MQNLACPFEKQPGKHIISKENTPEFELTYTYTVCLHFIICKISPH